MLPIRNEGRTIEGCVRGLLEQDYPAEQTEILIIDGMSEDVTRALVQGLIAELPERKIRLLDNPMRIVPPALNIGIREAASDIIIRMDGHTVPDRNYLSRCVEALNKTGAANVGGAMTYVGRGTFGKAVALAQGHVLGAGDAKFHYATEPAVVDTVPMGAFDKTIFVRAGLFDESMVRNQDYEMNVRIRKAGAKIYLDPAIKSAYKPRETPVALWRQYFQYGWWKVETLRRHPGSLVWRQLLPAVFVAAFLLLTVLSPWVLARALLSAQLFCYLGAIAVAALRLPRREDSQEPLRLLFMVALMILHFAWGSGFLISLISWGTFPYRAKPPAIPQLTHLTRG